MKSYTFKVLLSISFVFAVAMTASADFKSGLAAYQQNDYQTALRDLQADGGADASYVLSVMYYNGQGVEADKRESLKWLRKSADLGLERAQYNLAMVYDKGELAPKDLSEAAKWYRKAAEKGNVQSQFNIGLMYTNGEGVAKDKKEALKWLNKAAKQGHPGARKLVKVMNDKNDHALKSKSKEGNR